MLRAIILASSGALHCVLQFMV